MLSQGTVLKNEELAKKPFDRAFRVCLRDVRFLNAGAVTIPLLITSYED